MPDQLVGGEITKGDGQMEGTERVQAEGAQVEDAIFNPQSPGTGTESDVNNIDEANLVNVPSD